MRNCSLSLILGNAGFLSSTAGFRGWCLLGGSGDLVTG